MRAPLRTRRGATRVGCTGGVSPACSTYFLGKGDKYVIGKVDAIPSFVGCCVLFGRVFAFFNVLSQWLSYFFGQFVDTGHVQSAALALHYP